jgi:sterol desaturase/sphingolipid hydroxylase (fatty acid hydroxylase superfamily)
MSIILYAIPVFFLLIAAELIAEKVRNTQYYRVNDAISSLSVGVLSRMIGVLKALVPLTFYVLAFEHFAIFELPQTWWMWLAIFILYDFFYYWNHRCGHEISLFWAAHVVHHSSEDYNLTTALRQSSGSFFNFIFFIPLALLGVDPLVLISVGSVNLVYQFWVHTQHVGKLGVLEWFMVTPSNHRVHHAQNQIYLDRNYGGVFIIWDRLFGTYQDELASEKPIYGVRKALKSWNPFFANIQVYKQLIQDSLHTKRWADKLKVWFGRTGWRPEDVMQKFPMDKVDLSQFKPYNTSITGAKKAYCILQYVLIAIVGVYLMMSTNLLAMSEQLIIALLVVAASVNVAWIMENRTIALWLEWPKTLLLAVGLLYFGLLSESLLALSPVVVSAVLLGFVHIQHQSHEVFDTPDINLEVNSEL